MDDEFLIYKSSEEDVSVNALVQNESIWLTQKGMSELFGVDKSNMSRHLKNIFSEGASDENMVVVKIATTTQHGAIEGKLRE